MTNAKQLLTAAKAIQADAVALGLDKPAGHDPDRLRLLEAVAEAARVILDAYWADEGRLFETTEAGVEALAALEAYDE